MKKYGLTIRNAACFLACTAFLSASDWPRFRGPNGTGVSTDRGLPEEIDRDMPNLVEDTIQRMGE